MWEVVIIDGNVDALMLLDGKHGAERLMVFTDAADIEVALHHLAEGIVTNPLWHQLSEARLVGRSGATPLLAVFGVFTPFESGRLFNLAVCIDSLLSSHRFIDYPAAERACLQLAKLFDDRYGRDAISRFYFTAIPRGGVIVLGMLSYLLDLRPEQLILSPHVSVPQGKVLVVIDDCSLTGVRFQQFLGQVEADAVIFCPLFSVPELCQTIEREEPRVAAVLCAEVLKDIGRKRLGDAYERWREMRWEQAGGHGYRVGLTENVSFAWCEPQSRYWNTETQRLEAGWNILAPSRCLKRRALAVKLDELSGESSRHDPIALVQDGPGPWRLAEGVLWADYDVSLAIVKVPKDTAQTAPCFRLEGSAAEMWRGVLEHGTLEGVESALLERYDVDPAMLREDLAAFVAELVEHELLIYR